MNTNKTRVLIKTSLGYNGISSVTMNYFKNMSLDKIKVDFVVCDEIDYMRKDFLEYIYGVGSNLFTLPQPSRNIFRYIMEVWKLLNYGNYHIIHINGNSACMLIDVLLAALCGVKIRITHCHNTSCKFKLLHYLFKPILNFMVTERFACSNPAGRWVYNNKYFKVVQNGINFDNYKYNSLLRELIRKKFDLSDKFVLCHVGSFIDAKNHNYLIDIFKEITRCEPKSVLILIGDGPLRSFISKKVANLSLEKNVIFIGNVSDVEKYYSAADIFILPSKFEGLPLVLIEAQASGLNCFISDTVTDEVNITNNVTCLSILHEPKVWAEKIIAIPKNNSRENIKYKKNASEFNIKKNSIEMEEFYVSKKKEVYATDEHM